MNNNTRPNSEPLAATSASELPWLAFCYVANELDAKTKRAFEIRLEHDQTAREAVAEAFDKAWLLNQAVAQSVSETSKAACDLVRPESKRLAPAWTAAVLGIAIAGLLATVLLQLSWHPTEKQVAQNTVSPTLSERTNTSISLAETWADADWDDELEAESVAETQSNPSDSEQELVFDDGQDDWMTSALIDMAENVDVPPYPAGS